MAYNYLDKLLDQYAKSQGLTVSDPSSEIDPVHMAKEQLKELIIKEVLREKHDEYTELIRNELIEEREQSQLESIKTFIIDGLFLAVLVGILTNQITDIITWLKMQTDITQLCLWLTIAVIILLSIIILFCVYYRYITKITSLVRDRKRKRK